MLKKNNKKLKGKIGYGRYRFCKIVIAILLAMTVGAFVVAGNYIIPLAALIAASGLMYFLKTRVNAVLSDERIEKIAGKAARAVYTLLVFGMAVSSVVLMALKEKNPSYEVLGYVLSYTACGAMIVYIIAFNYYNRKKLE